MAQAEKAQTVISSRVVASGGDWKARAMIWITSQVICQIVSALTRASHLLWFFRWEDGRYGGAGIRLAV